MTSEGQQVRKRQAAKRTLGDALYDGWRGVRRLVLRPFTPKWEKEYHRIQEEERRQARRQKKRRDRI